MIAFHRNHCRTIARAPLPNAHRMTEDSERRPEEPEGKGARHLGNIRHLNWEVIVIWSFVAFSFTAFFLCGLILAAKCRGEWPP